MKRVVLVTGAYRGLGLETAETLARQGDHVIVTARNEAEGLKAVDKIKNQSGSAEFIYLDVSDPASIEKMADEVLGKWQKVDVLVNNAGVFLDQGEARGSALKVKPEVILDSFRTNSLGPFLIMQKLLPVMMERNYGRIVNVSSGMGQLSDMEKGSPSYRTSKTALNAMTRFLAEETKKFNIKINAVCPGWVRTEMGGPAATRSLSEGARGIVWAANLPDNGPTGGFFRDGEPLPW